MRNHVAEHLWPDRPGSSPAISAELLYAPALAAERFGERGLAASGALGQCGTRLPRRASRTVQLVWNSQVWRRQPDPLCPHIVHVGKNSRNRTHVSWRFGFPCGRMKILNKNLIQAIIGRKDPNCGLAKLNVSPASGDSHGVFLLRLSCFRAAQGIRPVGNSKLRIRRRSKVYCAGGVAGAPVSPCLVNSKLHGRPRSPAPSSRFPVPDAPVNFAST
jgi:hypothetical protein